MQQFPNAGSLVWTGLRPARKQAMNAVNVASIDTRQGLVGNHYAGKNGKRQVTLFQYEYLSVIE